MLKYLAAGLTAAFFLFGVLGPAAAEKRVALVIGNSAYQHTAVLKNPSNDATDMAATLRQLGFDVIDGNDLTKDEMEQRIRCVRREARRRRCWPLLLCRSRPPSRRQELSRARGRQSDTD